MAARLMPRRALLALTAVVAAVHALLLGEAPHWASDAAAQAQPTPLAFHTRTIAAAPPPTTQLSPPQPPQKPAATAPARPSSPPKARPVTEPASSLPAPTATLPSEPEPAPEQIAAAPSEPSPDPATHAEPPAPPASSASDPEQESANTPAAMAIQPAGGGPTQPLPDTVTVPASVRLTYDVAGQAKRFDYSAQAELLWQHDGQRYEARQEIRAFLVGSRVQRSTGTITAQGLQPERFGDKSRSEQAAHFDYARGRVTFSANTPEAPIGPGAQDRLSVFIQLGALIGADPQRLGAGTQISLTTVSARNADRWTFSVEGQETLALPAGSMSTWKLQRLPRQQYDQKAELWVAPSLGYLPVRIRITQANGDFADLRLSNSATP